MTGKEAMRRDVRQTRINNHMLRQASNQAIVYIEGDTDKRFYIWATDSKLVQLQTLRGKDNVLQAIRADNRDALRGRLAIIDSDYDHIRGITPYEDKNLVVTDTHDIETLMFEACGFRVIEDEYIESSNIGFLSREGKSLWTYVVSFATQMGRLRLLSIEQKWKLNFKEAEQYMSDFFRVNDGTPGFEFYEYMKYIVNNSRFCSHTYNDIKQAYDSDKREFDQWQICRGHDLSLMLSIMYSSNMYGTFYVRVADIERTLRASYRGSRKFKKSMMYQEIRNWQRQNQGWKILCDELS